jgi:hypothetical protein
MPAYAPLATATSRRSSFLAALAGNDLCRLWQKIPPEIVRQSHQIKYMFTFTGSSRGHDRFRSSGDLHPLNNDELQSFAPSVFAQNAMPGVSENYSFLPTIHAVDGLRQAGWQPVWVSEQLVRLEPRRGFQKHMIRFQRSDLIGRDTEYCPEICLVNSHDRSSAYQLHAGIFRLVCGNGLVIADSTFERVSIRHTGFNPSLVVDASLKVLDSLPQLTDAVESFRARRLTPTESKAFAESAILLRYDDLPTAPISAEKLLEPRQRGRGQQSLGHAEPCPRGGLKRRFEGLFPAQG